jgi:hypothetical protein
MLTSLGGKEDDDDEDSQDEDVIYEPEFEGKMGKKKS